MERATACRVEAHWRRRAYPTKPWRSRVCPPQAHDKNAEGVLSLSLGLPRNLRGYPRYPSFILFGLDAEGVAQSRYIGTSASQPAPQLKTKNSTLTIPQKIGKPRQGKASVLTPPREGVPGPRAQRHKPFTAKTLIFRRFIHSSTVKCGRVLPPNWVVFTPKNMQFMTDFCSSQFVNNRQRTLALIASTLLPRRSTTKAAAKTGQRFNASTTFHSTLFDLIRGVFSRKNSQFFSGTFIENHWEILRKWPKKPCKNTPKKHAIFAHTLFNPQLSTHPTLNPERFRGQPSTLFHS